MRRGEAKAIGTMLEQIPVQAVSPCLNIGSSTYAFREIEQPHINQYIFGPLGRRGVRVLHADLKAEDGVDIAGSIYDADVLERILAEQPQLVMCCNMFEHVTDRGELARRLQQMVPAGGLLLVTVPNSYPIHYDPIDTYFRPSPDQVCAMFPGFEAVRAEVWSDTTFLQDLLRDRGVAGTVAHLLKSAAKFVMPWRSGGARWVAHFHRYLWLFRPYRVTGVLMRKT